MSEKEKDKKKKEKKDSCLCKNGCCKIENSKNSKTLTENSKLRILHG